MAPKLFNKGAPTNTLIALREISKASLGLSPNQVPPRSGGFPAVKMRTYVSNNLLSIGWIEARNSGPRGGKRYFITEMGQHVLDLIEKDGMHYVRSLWLAYPEMIAEMKQLGIEPEESF